MNFILTIIWIIGVAIYIGKRTIHLKRRHAYKIRMKWKSEGYGLQVNTLCQKLYRYQIFMCTDPVTKIYLAKIL